MRSPAARSRWVDRKLHVAVDLSEAPGELCNVRLGGENLEPAGLQREGCGGRMFNRTSDDSGGHDSNLQK